MSKAANQVLPECGTFSTTTRVVFAVTLYLSFFDGWLIGLRAALRAVLWMLMVRMIDLAIAVAATSWRRNARIAVWLRALRDGPALLVQKERLEKG